MVIAGIVGDHDHPSRSRGAGPVEGFQEDKEGSTVELVGLAMKEELAVAKPNRTKVTYAAASRMMEQNRVLGLRRDPHLTARTMLLKMHLVGCPQVHLRIGYQRLEFFLCAFWRCGSACATMGRGLRKRNPNCRNTLWHWRTPKRAPYCRSIHADKALPSHRLPAMPTSRGALRRTASTSPHCFGLSRRGRPGRSPSCKPANPASSKRRTQYSTERGASPSKAATSGQVKPCATKSTPCKQ